jgi:FHS family L-fucose permease-like MFS transporter
MMIMGGGFVSLLQGYVADITTIQSSYIVGLLLFCLFGFYAWKSFEFLKNTRISLIKN